MLPEAAGGEEVYIGGPNAGAIDFAEDTGSRLPLMIMVVIAMSLVLLVVLVRSVTIALQAAVMNLLSIGAAYGVLVAVVQWGWLGSVLGFPTEMPVTTWVPMMMFPLLFGLSMDYEVFLISRIREEYERTGDTRTAVTLGLARTAKVITAAAAIMIAIFTTALLGPDVSVKQIGLGMAVAVLVDATIIRMILVPAVMELCGKANWWMPGRRAPKATSAALAEVGQGASVWPLLESECGEPAIGPVPHTLLRSSVARRRHRRLAGTALGARLPHVLGGLHLIWQYRERWRSRASTTPPSAGRRRPRRCAPTGPTPPNTKAATEHEAMVCWRPRPTSPRPAQGRRRGTAVHGASRSPYDATGAARNWRPDGNR
ncbi:MMPL family transporter [Micromonospora zhanjiangensis]